MTSEQNVDERISMAGTAADPVYFEKAGSNFAFAGETTSAPVSVLFDPECYYNKKYATDEELSLALQNAYSGSALTQILGAPITWPKDLSMMKWARAVMCNYDRDIPKKSSGSKWADRSDLFFFDAAVKYFKKFEYRWIYSNADCFILKGMTAAIDNERTNVMQLKTAGKFGTGELGHYLTVLKDLQSKIDNTYASLNCDKYIASVEQDEFADRTQQQLKGALELTKSDKTATYVIIGMVVLIVGASGYLIFKK